MSHTLGADASATRARRDQITALLAAGGLEACRDAVLDETATGPEGLVWCADLAVAVLRAHDVRTAAALADLLTRVRRGSTRRPARRSTGRALRPCAASLCPELSVATLRHDADQFALLRRRGLVGQEFDPVIADYRALADRAAAAPPGTRRPVVTDHEADRIAHVYGRIVHVADAPRVPHALSPGWSAGAVEAPCLDGGPEPVVVDEFLSGPAWNGLQRFCQESTVWSDTGTGHLTSSFFDGFSCHLVVQIAEELRARLPQVVGTRRLAQVHAVKHPPFRRADAAAAGRRVRSGALDVVLWVTPTAANLDPASGGMVVGGAPTTVVPYRGNRAVLLGPGLAHRTDDIRFAPGYEQRRVAVTLQYGAA